MKNGFLVRFQVATVKKLKNITLCRYLKTLELQPRYDSMSIHLQNLARVQVPFDKKEKP